MIKITYQVVADHYGVHRSAVAQMAKKYGGFKKMKGIIGTILYYESKKSIEESSEFVVSRKRLSTNKAHPA